MLVYFTVVFVLCFLFNRVRRIDDRLPVDDEQKDNK